VTVWQSYPVFGRISPREYKHTGQGKKPPLAATTGGDFKKFTRGTEPKTLKIWTEQRAADVFIHIDSTHGETYTYLLRIMAQVPKVEDTELLLDKLGWVGTIKLNLPVITRSWLNELGLYVQLHYVGGQGRLQAGGMHRSYFDAWGKEGQAIGQWEVRNYDRKTWSRRFAHLVWPTYDLALYVGGPILWDTRIILPSGDLGRLSELDDATFRKLDQSMKTLIKQVVAHFNETQEWLGLLELYCQSCGRRLYVWETHRRICPYCNAEL
jgi:hypothetical protein